MEGGGPGPPGLSLGAKRGRVLGVLRREDVGLWREMAEWGWGMKGEGLTHRLEEPPRLLWAELPSCFTLSQKRPITSSNWGSWCTISGCWVSQYLRVV